jgi:maleylpyruvate isomerase
MRDWLDVANTWLWTALERVDDDAFAQPSALDGWSNGHVVAHLHLNAEALGRLVTWASTGVETPMYASPAQRNADIAAVSTVPPPALRRLVHDSAETLDRAFDVLTPEMWANTVVTSQGRTVPATELVWMRFREVAVHGIDLATGMTFADLPPDAVAKLVGEIVAKRLAAGEASALAAWLTGRVDGGPILGPWL